LRSMPLSSGNGYHISSMRRVERIDAGVVRPFHYTMQAGNIVSAFAGSGIEFHSVVSYAGSPESRRINWKTTARTGELWFNRYSSERSGTAVILLDLRQIASDEELTVRFAERAVQAALSFAYSSLQERNAVGMIAIGERVISIRTDFGRRHYERISRALMLMRPSREYSPVRLDAAASRYAHYASQLIVITPLHERDDVDSIASLSISHRDILLVVPMLHHRESAASAMQIAAEITRLRQQNNAIAASRFCRTFVWEQDVDLGMISELPGYAAGRMRR
ncbi:MAG: DUF58 domain-containing protein, partial [Thermoplasmata archaeon]|nr:DUF58 domain-containing protein [Candidatus Sysuiplasma superficiale]